MSGTLRVGAALLAALLVSGGCGDMVPRGVEVITEPPGATVRLGREKIGESPVLIPWKKIKDHYADTFTVEIRKKGYRPRHLVAAQYGGTMRVALQKE